MMFSNVIVAIKISCGSYVFNHSCVEVPIISYFSFSKVSMRWFLVVSSRFGFPVSREKEVFLHTLTYLVN